MPDDEERSRFSSDKAVAAAFLLLGVVLVALSILIAVLIQRAC